MRRITSTISGIILKKKKGNLYFSNQKDMEARENNLNLGPQDEKVLEMAALIDGSASVEEMLGIEQNRYRHRLLRVLEHQA